jgi:hypothetical protein
LDASVIIGAFFRLFKLLSFHPRLGLVSRTLIHALPQLGYFLITTLLVFWGFSTAAYVIFSPQAPALASFGGSSLTILLSILTGLDYDEFELWRPSQHMNGVASIPFFLFYFGFVAIGFILFLHVLLAIVVAAHNAVRAKDEQASAEEPQLGLWGEMTAGCFQTAKSLGCTSRAVQPSSKFGPQLPTAATLSPRDAERVRPALTVMFNELLTVYQVLSAVSDEHGVEQSVPVTRLEAGAENQLTAVWTWPQLCQCFSQPTALYLWAKFGPGPDEAAKPKQPVHAGLQESELLRKIDDLSARLDLAMTAFAMGAFSGSASQTEELQEHEEEPEPSAQGVNAAALVAAEQEEDEEQVAQAASEAIAKLFENNDEHTSPSCNEGESVARVAAAAASTSDETEIESMTRKLLERLLVDKKACQIEKIKHECKKHQPVIPLEVARRVRVQMGLKQTVLNRGTSHEIRVWRYPSTNE